MSDIADIEIDVDAHLCVYVTAPHRLPRRLFGISADWDTADADPSAEVLFYEGRVWIQILKN